MYLPPGPATPNTDALDAFWQRVRIARPELRLPAAWQVRWIGLDAPSTAEVLELIRNGDKTGTFTLPWLVECTGVPPPAVGDGIMLIDYDGSPAVGVRLTRIQEVEFGRITAADTAIDGSPVRALEIWKPLHTRYWNALLEPFGLSVSDDMPVWVETFELLWPGAEVFRR